MKLPPIPRLVYGILGPITVRLEDDPKDGNIDLLGYWEPSERVIVLRKGMPPELTWATLEHERTHAALFECGVGLPDDVEERVCHAVAAHFTAHRMRAGA